MPDPVASLKFPASSKRQRLMLGAAIAVVVIAGVFVGLRARRGAGGEGPAPGAGAPAKDEGVLARLTERCYAPAASQEEEARKTAPPLATDGAEFVRGLESLPFLAAIFAQRDTTYEEDNTKDPAVLAGEAKTAALQAADRAIQVAECYERELEGERSSQEAARQLVADLRAQRAEIETTDFAPFYSVGEPAETTLTLAPKEEKSVRLRTLCIDRFAQPPPAGMPYILSGTVDALMKPELCDILRGAAAGGNLAGAQNAVWRLEQQRATPGTPPVTPVEGATGAYAAQSDRRLAVSATATGTLTTLDATFTNLSDTPLTIDTSCAIFVPLVVPDTDKPLPTPPPDYSDPATLERLQRESTEQLLRNLDEYERSFREQGLPFPPQLEEQRRQLQEQLAATPPPSPEGEVRGVYSQAFLPGADVDPDTLDPFQPYQTGGIGAQPLGSRGWVRKAPPPRRWPKPPRPWDILRRDRRIEARERLERALDRYARTPADPGVVEDLFREFELCWINGCMPDAELRRNWDQVSGRQQRIVDVTIGRVQDSTTAETVQDVINALRLCQAVGPPCTTDAASQALDRHFRDYLRQQQSRRRSAE